MSQYLQRQMSIIRQLKIARVLQKSFIKEFRGRLLLRNSLLLLSSHSLSIVQFAGRRIQDQNWQQQYQYSRITESFQEVATLQFQTLVTWEN